MHRYNFFSPTNFGADPAIPFQSTREKLDGTDNRNNLKYQIDHKCRNKKQHNAHSCLFTF